ncbi:MAG: cyclic nucleotide-binding domain-containing protein [Clostridiales bacterium]|nr:cyclic nucleotide-binding domain-containing protein [Clostridiales bacterium]
MQKQPLPKAYYPQLAQVDLGELDPAAAQLIRFERGDWMLLAEQPFEYLYILLSGKAKVYMSETGGRTLLLCYYISEGIMGDVELMMGRREAISSVQALTPVVCIGLPLSVYAPALLSHPPFLLRVGRGLANKLHDSVANTTEIILRPFEARLCAYLLQSAQNRLFSERLTDVSEQLGVSYRHLLRSLKALCDADVLEKRAAGYFIRNERALRQKAAG